MRLIDTDSIKFTEYINGDITVSKAAIEKMPTAYDVDKVVERLEKLNRAEKSRAAEYDEAGRLDMMDIHDAKAETYRNSRRIVKSGGIE